MEVYGKKGYITCINAKDMVIMENETDGSYTYKAAPLPYGMDDPFALLQKVVHKEYQLPAYDISAPDNNLLVMQILEAAKYSAETGTVVNWNEFFSK